MTHKQTVLKECIFAVLSFLEKKDATMNKATLRISKEGKYAENNVLQAVNYLKSTSYVELTDKVQGCGPRKLRITRKGREKLRLLREEKA